MGKVLIATAVFPPEPVVSAKLSFDIANRIHETGQCVEVVSPRPSRPMDYSFDNDSVCVPYKHIVLNSYVCPLSKFWGRLRESYSFGKELRKHIISDHESIDVIYANIWPVFAQFFLARVSNRYKIPYFVHVQDVYPESYCYKLPKVLGSLLSRFLLPLDRYVLRKAKGVICISPSMMSYLSETRGLSINDVVLARNWQDDKLYIDAYTPIRCKSDICKLMYVGSINPTANVQLIISAVSKLKKDSYSLQIIGNGPSKSACIELAARCGVNASFNTVTPEQVAEIQSTADILILCLKKGVAKTATPSKLTAYLLSGRPIVAGVDLDSDCASIIREAQCGIVVEPDNLDSLANAIQTLSNSSLEKLKEMGDSGYNYAINNLTREKNLNIIVNTILE